MEKSPERECQAFSFKTTVITKNPKKRMIFVLTLAFDSVFFIFFIVRTELGLHKALGHNLKNLTGFFVVFHLFWLYILILLFNCFNILFSWDKLS